MSERLTHTKRSDFRNCPRYFYWRHEQRLELRAQRPGRRRGHAFGTAIFAAAQHLTAGGDPGEFDAVIDASVEDTYDEVYERVSDEWEAKEIDLEMVKVEVMALKYVQRYGIDQRREIVFDLPLRSPVTGRPMRAFRRAGKIDGIVITGDKTCDVVEDKFTQQITQVMLDRLPLDSQILEYVDALREVGWQARVRYRHTRYPSINPEKGKEYKTKPNKPEETLAEFKFRLSDDVDERPEFYFNEQTLMLAPGLLDEHRGERWVTAHEILAKRRLEREVGVVAWNKTTSKCLDFGGCPFIPLCGGWEDAMDRYVLIPDNAELQKETSDA